MESLVAAAMTEAVRSWHGSVRGLPADEAGCGYFATSPGRYGSGAGVIESIAVRRISYTDCWHFEHVRQAPSAEMLSGGPLLG